MPNNANYLATLNCGVDSFYTALSAGAFNQRSATGSFAAFVAFIVRGDFQRFALPLSVITEQWLWGNADGSSGWSLTLENGVEGPVFVARVFNLAGVAVSQSFAIGNVFERLTMLGLWFDGTNVYLSANGVVVTGVATAGIRNSARPPRLGADALGGPAVMGADSIDFISCGYAPVDLDGAAGTASGTLGRLVGSSYVAFCEALDGAFLDPNQGIDWLHRYSIEAVSAGLLATTVKTVDGSRVTAAAAAPATLPDVGNGGPVSGGSGGPVALTRTSTGTVSGRKSPFQFYDVTGSTPSIAPTPPGTVVDLYVSSVLGDDNNPGTQALPLATLNRVDELIPTTIEATTYRVHLRNESYPTPINNGRNGWLRARTYQGGLIDVLADEVWDPTVYAITLTQVAQAGTGTAVIVGAGLVVNAHRGDSIRMTSGAAAGQTRRINSNTATNIDVNNPFTIAPAAGDTFEIFRLNVVIESTLVSGTTRYAISGDMLLASAAGGGAAVTPGTGVQGLRFTGLNLGTPGNQIAFGLGQVHLFGVQCNQTTQFNRTTVISGVALSTSDRGYAIGWGARFTTGSANPVLGGGAGYLGSIHHDTGFINAADPGCFVNITLGGFINRNASAELQGTTSITANAATPVQIDLGFSHFFPSRLSLGVVNLNTNAGPLLSVTRGAHVIINTTVVGVASGGTTVEVRSGGQLLCNGAPALGSAVANDWVVQGMAAFNRAALAAVASAVLSTVDGSCATRFQ